MVDKHETHCVPLIFMFLYLIILCSLSKKIMLQGRGGGFGLDKHIHEKKLASYDHALEAEVKQWIADVTGIPWGPQSFAERLHDGQMLCSVVNAIEPGKVRVNNSHMPFKQVL